MKAFVRDEATQGSARDFSEAGQVLTVEQLGKKQFLTPEGFLYCEEVVIARTGIQLYAAGETPIPAGPEGVVKVMRSEAEVFNPVFIASLNGKPMTDEHPMGGWEDQWAVTPENWDRFVVGTCFNVRRGENELINFLIADLLVCKRDTIEKVRSGKREISVGYNVIWNETAPGEGEQTNMMGNHIALVVAGRCGSQCAIGDHQSIGVTDMASKLLEGLFAKLRHAISVKDEAGAKAVEAEIAAAKDAEVEEEEAKKEKAAADKARDERMDTMDKKIGDMSEGMKKIGDSVARKWPKP